MFDSSLSTPSSPEYLLQIYQKDSLRQYNFSMNFQHMLRPLLIHLEKIFGIENVTAFADDIAIIFTTSHLDRQL
jgi:hypothetical protein